MAYQHTKIPTQGSKITMGSDGTLRTSGFFNPGQNSTTAVNGSIRWSGVYLRDWRLGRDYDYALLYLEDTQDVASTDGATMDAVNDTGIAADSTAASDATADGEAGCGTSVAAPPCRGEDRPQKGSS